jgi:hypothetical protein
MEVTQSIRLPAPVGEVWKRIGGFNALPDWHPSVEAIELAEGWRVRKLRFPGGVIVERLEGKDDITRTYSYAITDSPLPVADYHATLRVRQEGDETVVEWESRTQGRQRRRGGRAIQRMFEAGFETLKKMFG